jgi:hypothetical protein
MRNCLVTSNRRFRPLRPFMVSTRDEPPSAALRTRDNANSRQPNFRRPIHSSAYDMDRYQSLPAVRWANADGFSSFAWLQTVTSVLGFYVMVLILITQRHENRLEETRAQLTLQVAMLVERKNAKVIDLLEQLRRDHPNIADRVDEDATAMSKPTDAEAVIEAITSSQEPGQLTRSV